jgi:3-polyprenyl-4-hydroxybenzoate decarboxylase
LDPAVRSLRIGIELELKLEIAEICERSLRTDGPALLMDKV